MSHLLRLIVMEVLNVPSSVADTVITSMKRSGINEQSVTLRELVVAARVAHADCRERGNNAGERR